MLYHMQQMKYFNSAVERRDTGIYSKTLSDS